MTTKGQISKTVKETLSETGVPSPEMVQDYIACMLRELSEMAQTSGLPHVSSLLQVSLLAVRTNSNMAD